MSLTLWSLETRKPIGKLSAGIRAHSQISRIQFSANGRYVAASGYYSALLWDVSQSQKILEFTPGKGSSIYDIVFSPDNQMLVVAVENSICGFGVTDGKLLKKHTIGDAKDSVGALSFLPDSKRLFLWQGEREGHHFGRLIDISTGKTLMTFKNDDQFPVRYSCAIPDSRHVVTGGFDGAVVMWDVESGKKIASWSVGNSRIAFLEYSKKQDLIVAASEDGTFWFNSAKSHGNGRSVQYNPLGCGSVSADGSIVALGLGDGSDPNDRSRGLIQLVRIGRSRDKK